MVQMSRFAYVRLMRRTADEDVLLERLLKFMPKDMRIADYAPEDDNFSHERSMTSVLLDGVEVFIIHTDEHKDTNQIMLSVKDIEALKIHRNCCPKLPIYFMNSTQTGIYFREVEKYTDQIDSINVVGHPDICGIFRTKKEPIMEKDIKTAHVYHSLGGVTPIASKLAERLTFNGVKTHLKQPSDTLDYRIANLISSDLVIVTFEGLFKLDSALNVHEVSCSRVLSSALSDRFSENRDLVFYVDGDDMLYKITSADGYRCTLRLCGDGEYMNVRKLLEPSSSKSTPESVAIPDYKNIIYYDDDANYPEEILDRIKKAFPEYAILTRDTVLSDSDRRDIITKCVRYFFTSGYSSLGMVASSRIRCEQHTIENIRSRFAERPGASMTYKIQLTKSLKSEVQRIAGVTQNSSKEDKVVVLGGVTYNNRLVVALKEPLTNGKPSKHVYKSVIDDQMPESIEPKSESIEPTSLDDWFNS